MSMSSWPPGAEVPPLLAALVNSGATSPPWADSSPSGAEMLTEIAAGEARIKWFGVNDRRVDAVVSVGASEYRVVYFTSDGRSVEHLAVFRRPPRFDGLDGGRVVVVNGPSGSGKSTVLEAIAARSTLPWVLFDEPVVGVAPAPYLIWRQQSPALHRGFLDATAAVARRGNLVGLSAAGHPPDLIDEVFEGIEAVRVGLDCPFETLVERERGRDGRWGGLVQASVGDHEGWRYDLRCDTGNTSPDHIARMILDRLGLPSI